jgi:hypothetical protein
LKKCSGIVLSAAVITGEDMSSEEIIREIVAIDDLALYSQKLTSEKNGFWLNAIEYYVTYYE